jgi:hypothetical protein
MQLVKIYKPMDLRFNALFKACFWIYTYKPYVQYFNMQCITNVYALEERIQDCKNKWHNHILRIDSS